MAAESKSYDMLVDADVYIDNVDGNDDMARMTGRFPFKTLDAAAEYLDAKGDNFRFHFLSPGEYTWTMRVMVGAVVHFFSDCAKSKGDVTVKLNNKSPNGGTFFYDTHLNLTGTDANPMRLSALQYVEIEGGTLWTVGRAKFDCSYLYLIDGSGMLRHIEMERGYILGKFGNAVVEDVVIRNVEKHSAFDWTSGVVRIQGDGLKVARNPNGASVPAVVLKSCVSNLNAKCGGHPSLTANTGYSKFLDAYSGVTQVTDAVLKKLDALGAAKCSVGGLRVNGSASV